MGVLADDIIFFEMTCKFNYKNCEVIVKKVNNIVDVGIIGISKKGYILERHKTFTFDQRQFNSKLLIYIEKKIGYVEEMHNKLVEEGIRNDSKIRDFEAI